MMRSQFTHVAVLLIAISIGLCKAAPRHNHRLNPRWHQLRGNHRQLVCHLPAESRCIAARETVTDPFSCNTCTCTAGGMLACTRKACPKPGCLYAGRLWPLNQTFEDPTSHRRCECREKIGVMCPLIYAPKVHCKYEGQIYQPGDSFAHADCCNTCTCDNGHIFCTEMACQRFSGSQRMQPISPYEDFETDE